jgi:hypothetical protein
MCFMVSALPPPKSTVLQVLVATEFEHIGPAQEHAEELLKSGHTQVRVWKLHSTPKTITTIQWD